MNAVSSVTTSENAQDGLFSMMLRLHPVEAGQVLPNSGKQIQAAFLAMIRQSDPELSEQLHLPNQRRPYTLSLLQGFNHLTSQQIAEATARRLTVSVLPGQVYWLRITIMDVAIFRTFTQHLIFHAHTLRIRIGETDFEISRLLTTSDPSDLTHPWIAHSSFTSLHQQQAAYKQYDFEFASPTAFSMGQKSWGKQLHIFPDVALVFGGLARLWDIFAPAHLHLTVDGLSDTAIATWCEDYVVTSQYTLETRYLSSSKFGQVGFQGRVSYEVKGDLKALEARWLSTLARFAMFSGIGNKTTMGMGQVRCTSLPIRAMADLQAKNESGVHL